VINTKTLYQELKLFEHADLFTKFRMLLMSTINDLREKNDNAIPEDVLRNQGAIKELKIMYKRLGGTEKFKEHNSAMDE